MTFEVRVAASVDDAEECVATNTIYFDSSDLEIIRDDHAADAENPYPYSFITMERR